MTKRIGLGLTSLNTMGATPFLMAAEKRRRRTDADTRFPPGATRCIPNADNATPSDRGRRPRNPFSRRRRRNGSGSDSKPSRFALELGNDINAVDKNGETAMHGAAYKNLPGVVQLLADTRSGPCGMNRKNSHGWTPLIIAQGHRFGNFQAIAGHDSGFRSSDVRRAGITPVGEKVANPGKNSDYAPKTGALVTAASPGSLALSSWNLLLASAA